MILEINSLTFSIRESKLLEDDSKTRVVTDIHTYNGIILHNAAGYIHPIIGVCPDPGGTGHLAVVGYVLSYYEFPEPENRRLTDEDRIYLLSPDPPERLSWIADCFSY